MPPLSDVEVQTAVSDDGLSTFGMFISDNYNVISMTVLVPTAKKL